jgi:hypothetical protein
MSENLLTEEIPDKFKNPDNGELKIDALLRSYKELEKKLSSRPSAPSSPEEYCIQCDHGLFEADQDINKKLFEKGFTQDQAQMLYDLAAERMVPMLREISADLQADREVEKLIEHFGGPDQWREMSRQLLAFGQKNLPGDVLETLSSSYDGVLALHRMMKTEEPKLKRSASEDPSKLGELDLQSMMRDPKYWRDKDPSYVARVTDGFKKMYGGK